MLCLQLSEVTSALGRNRKFEVYVTNVTLQDFFSPILFFNKNDSIDYGMRTMSPSNIR
jgi:hypothetical protein